MKKLNLICSTVLLSSRAILDKSCMEAFISSIEAKLDSTAAALVSEAAVVSLK